MYSAFTEEKHAQTLTRMPQHSATAPPTLLSIHNEPSTYPIETIRKVWKILSNTKANLLTQDDTYFASIQPADDFVFASRVGRNHVAFRSLWAALKWLQLQKLTQQLRLKIHNLKGSHSTRLGFSQERQRILHGDTSLMKSNWRNDSLDAPLCTDLVGQCKAGRRVSHCASWMHAVPSVMFPE